MSHVPVLLNSVIQYLDPQPNQNFIDATVGGGGHSIKILQHTIPRGVVMGIDWDRDALRNLKSQNIPRLILHQGNFAQIENIAKEEKFTDIDGILFDFGFSSMQLENGRGFSFLKNEPLDMRYDMQQELMAEIVVNRYSKKDLEDILVEYGEETFGRKISECIYETRKKHEISTTEDLVGVLDKCLPVWYKKRKIHFATKTFQALRIEVNGELKNIEEGLDGAMKLLLPKSRLVAISFHSLEDRIVKNFFKKHKDELNILTKKPIAPNEEEIKANPRSRSAKLRAAQKI